MSESTFRVMGIDPSLRNLGYAIVNYDSEKGKKWVTNCGLIKTPTRYKGQEALLWMIQAVKQLKELEQFESCDQYVIETPPALFMAGISRGSVMPVANIAGACAAVFSDDGMGNVSLPYPAEWNKAKSKGKTRDILEQELGMFETWDFDNVPNSPTQFEHIIDAAGMALWYIENHVSN